jgi:peroxiredoxin/outer membrane lipoprotein-sorting protein
MVLLLALLASLPLSPDSTNQLVGTWLSRDSSTRGVTQIVITNENGVLRAHSWSGACAPTDCDWGVTEVTLNEGTLMATFNEGPDTTTIYFVRLPNSELLAVCKTESKGTPEFMDKDHAELFDRQKPDPSDENARVLLRKVAQAYGNLTTAELQFDFTHETTDQVTATHSSSHTRLLVSSSGKWRAETSGGGERSIGISDGQTVWAYFPELNEYIAFHTGNLRNTIVDRYRSIDQTRGSAAITASESLGDVDCMLVKIERPDSVRTLWIDPRTNFILKDDIATTHSTPISSSTSHSVTTFSPVRLLPSADDQVFSFDPQKVQARSRDQLRREAPTKSIETLAPDFTLPDLQNQPVKLSELKGKVVLLDFWATWCAPCRAALPNLELLHRDFKDKGLLVLGVDTEEPKDQGAFMEKFGYTFRSLVDANEKVKNLYHVGGIPVTVLIDKDGTIQTFEADGSSYDSLRETVRRKITF